MSSLPHANAKPGTEDTVSSTPSTVLPRIQINGAEPPYLIPTRTSSLQEPSPPPRPSSPPSPPSSLLAENECTCSGQNPPPYCPVPCQSDDRPARYFSPVFRIPSPPTETEYSGVGFWGEHDFDRDDDDYCGCDCGCDCGKDGAPWGFCEVFQAILYVVFVFVLMTNMDWFAGRWAWAGVDWSGYGVVSEDTGFETLPGPVTGTKFQLCLDLSDRRSRVWRFVDREAFGSCGTERMTVSVSGGEESRIWEVGGAIVFDKEGEEDTSPAVAPGEEGLNQQSRLGEVIGDIGKEELKVMPDDLAEEGVLRQKLPAGAMHAGFGGPWKRN